MKITIPIILKYDDISINLNDSTEAEYDYTGNTSYAPGAVVKVSFKADGTTRILPEKTFSCISENAAYPPDSVGWVDLGAVNRHKAWDKYINSKAAADGTEAIDPGKIVFNLKSDRADTVHLFGVEGTKVTYELKDSSGVVVYTEVDEDLEAGWVTDWEEYYFKDFPADHKVSCSFPVFNVSTMTITIEHSDVELYPKFGFFVIGQSVYMGATQYGAKPGFMDFSSVERNTTTGSVYSNPGNYADTLNVMVNVKNQFHDKVRAAAISVRGTPAVFDANNDGTSYESLVCLGLLVGCDPVFERAGLTVMNMEIEGIT